MSQGGTVAELIPIDANGDIPAYGWDKISSAYGIIFGAPTYTGAPPWQFKKFADATSDTCFTRSWQDKVFARFANSASLNGDKQISSIALQTPASQQRENIVGTQRCFEGGSPGTMSVGTGN